MQNRKLKRGTWRLPALLLLLAALVLAVSFARQGSEKLKQAAYPTHYSEYVEYYAGKYAMDPMLIYAVIRTESGFKADAVSSVDARGLMQITEVTFQWLKARIAPTEEITFDDIYDPETNIRFGSYYWACCLQRYGMDVSTAAAAYFAGWGTVDKLLAKSEYSDNATTLKAFPHEGMSLYVKKINKNYNMYREIYCKDETA